uniref:Helicase ATP-binding domain-containing protein n=1 Tax=Strongyloides venezuelensis TaxID=75913 RepID=A0A0K0FUY5_STRVS
MAYQQYNTQYNGVKSQYPRYDQNEMNGDFNNRGFNNQNKNNFQYGNNNDYDCYNPNHRQEPISRGGFDIKPDSSVHSLKTCTSSGSFGIVKGNSSDYKCYECSKPSYETEKVPFSFKNLQGIDSIQPFMPKHLEKRNGFTMFQGQNEHTKDIENFEGPKYERRIEIESKKEIPYERKPTDTPLYVDVSTKYDIIPPQLLIPIPSLNGNQNCSDFKYFSDYDNNPSIENNFHVMENDFNKLYEHGRNISSDYKQEDKKDETINYNLVEAKKEIKNQVFETDIDFTQCSLDERIELKDITRETKSEIISSPLQSKIDVVQVSSNKKEESDKTFDITNVETKNFNLIEVKGEIPDGVSFVRAHLTNESNETLKNWLETNCDKDAIRKIIETGFELPEKISSLIVPIIHKNRDLIVEVEDGPSKYISFLLPIIDDILKNNFENQYNEPIALVLSSSKESVLKFSEMTEKLIQDTSITFSKCYGQYPIRQNLGELKCGCNILISTPGRLIHFLKSGDISLENIKYLVVDEIDKMIECGFQEIITNILNEHNCSKKENRVNIVAATKFSSAFNELLSIIIRNTYTMVLKNITNDLGGYKIKTVEENINIYELSEKLLKQMLEMTKNKSSGGISLHVDIPDSTKQTFFFN